MDNQGKEIRRALAQGVSDHKPLDPSNEQHPFLGRSHPKKDNVQSKHQHRATAAATVSVVVAAVAAQIVVSCSKTGRARGAVREPLDPEIDSIFCGR